MGKSIGIDLGTTNSVMCHMTTEPEIILNRENKPLTPSVLAFKRSKKTGDAIIVGQNANDYAKGAGPDYLFSVKRLMGRSFDDPEVQKVKNAVTYEIMPSPDGAEDVARIQLGGDLYKPQDLSAMILKKLKEDAELRLNDQVDSAVITVPAYFSEQQKHATREAGLLAGLKVKRIIDEPTAAAIAYGIDQQSDEDKMVLVFDLGGGTFDVSILLILGGVFSQMDNEGDMWLGGDDFDRSVMNQVIYQVENEFDLKDLAANKDFMFELRKKAREAKEVLSSQDSAEIIITDVLKDEDNIPVPVEYEITRREFEGLVQCHVDKAMECVRHALQEANLEKDEIDVVLMVGGSSTIPSFQKAIEDYFGREKVIRNIDPMTCVAIGAGILAKTLAGVSCPHCQAENPLEAETCTGCGADLSITRDEPQRVENISRTPKPYGIEIEGDLFEELIPKNEVYPMEEPSIKEFKTTMPDQRLIKIPVREGASPKASENELMGNIWFYGLPGGLPEATPIEISMALDADGIFTIGCRIQGTDWKRQAVLQRGWESAILDEAMTMHVELMRQGLSASEAEAMEENVRGVEQAVGRGDRETAEHHRQELARIRDAQDVDQIDSSGAPSPEDEWRTPVQNIMNLGKNNLNRVRPILPKDDDRVRAFDDWCARAEKAMDTQDNVTGPGLVEEGKDKLFAVPLVGDLVLAAILASDPTLNPAVTTRLEQSKHEIFTSIDRNDVPAIKSAIDDFHAALNQALAERSATGGGPADIKTLLGKK